MSNWYRYVTAAPDAVVIPDCSVTWTKVVWDMSTYDQATGRPTRAVNKPYSALHVLLQYIPGQKSAIITPEGEKPIRKRFSTKDFQIKLLGTDDWKDPLDAINAYIAQEEKKRIRDQEPVQQELGLDIKPVYRHPDTGKIYTL